MKKLLYLLYIIVTSSCSRINSDEVIEKKPHVKTEKYQFDNRKHKMSEIIDNFKIIKLQTKNTPKIGKTGKIISYNNEIFIHNINSNKVEVFDSNGKYLRSIGKTGNEKGEYLELNDFVIDNIYIYLLDCQQKKIIKHHVNGSFSNQFDLDFFARQFEKVENGFIAIKSGKAKNVLRIMDNNFRFLKEMRTRSIIPILATKHLSISSDNSVLFSEPFCDTIFKIRGMNIVPEYKFDFGKQSSGNLRKTEIKNKFTQKNGLIDYDMIHKYYFTSPDIICENNKFIIFNIHTNHKGNTIIMDKKNQKIAHYSLSPSSDSTATFNDLTFTIDPIRFSFLFADEFISVLPSYLFKKETMIKYDNTWSMKQKERYEYIKKISSDLTENSNPLLLIADFKEITK